ncbi:MAG: hypothetical protein RBT59_06280 [Arcobacteraceae bacterium]|jgi:hypothetical protein|nr:hypothetical protein [Arcobacteraceae bacterium]
MTQVLHALSVEEWFANALNGKLNNSVLFLEINLPNSKMKLATMLDSKQKEFGNVKFNIVKFDNSTMRTDLTIKAESNNIVLREESPYEIDEFVKKKYQLFISSLAGYNILYVNNTSNFFANLDSYFSDIANNFNNKILYFSYIESVDFFDLVMNFRDDIFNYNKLESKEQTILSIPNLKRKTQLLNNAQNWEWIQSDIYVLKKSKVLTSRLAIVLYRFAFLNYSASHTFIGRYIHKLFGVKSKTMNAKSSPLIQCSLHNDLRNKNFKAYDLSINESEIAIRKEIAKNLISLGSSKINSKDIAKVTGLTDKIIETLKKKL